MTKSIFVSCSLLSAFYLASSTAGFAQQAHAAPVQVTPAPVVTAAPVKASPVKAAAAAAIAPTPPRASAAPPSDLLASVRAHMARLRAAPVPNTSSKIQENAARRRADQVKVLHDSNGDTTEASWPFTFKK